MSTVWCQRNGELALLEAAEAVSEETQHLLLCCGFGLVWCGFVVFFGFFFFFYYIKVNCKNDNFIQADHLELH